MVAAAAVAATCHGMVALRPRDTRPFPAGALPRNADPASRSDGLSNSVNIVTGNRHHASALPEVSN